ncbi:MAG: hypothetical protein RQ899_13610 [Pseudomonadales bacterium]|nr:hypothetical protein [Pseudomonadales bacterium]
MNMIQSLLSNPEEKIDTRIVKEDYRNYDLVARYWEYGYRGKIWKNRKSVEDIDAVDNEGIDELLQKLRTRVDELIEAKRKARRNKAPTQVEFNTSLKSLETKISLSERQVLKAHAAAVGAAMTLDKAQRLGDFFSPSAALLMYSGLARRLCEELAYTPSAARGLDATLSILLAEIREQGSVLVLNDMAVTAIMQSNW